MFNLFHRLASRMGFHSLSRPREGAGGRQTASGARSLTMLVADEHGGEFPPSDCWPSDVVRPGRDHELAALLLNRGGMPIGEAGVAEVDRVLRRVRSEMRVVHGRIPAASRIPASPGKLPDNTEAARETPA